MVTRKIALLSAVIGLTASSLATAALPTAGTTMDAVRGEFGEPKDTTLPIGQPEITRWVYDSFNVVFESERVVRAFPRIESVEKRSHSQIPERPDYVNLIDQSVNNPAAAQPAPETPAIDTAPAADSAETEPATEAEAAPTAASGIEATEDHFEQRVEVKAADEAAASVSAPEAVTSSQ